MLPDEVWIDWVELAEDLPIAQVKKILCDRYPEHVKAIDEWALWESAFLLGHGYPESLDWE